MDVIPVNLQLNTAVLGNCKMFLERDGGYIAINPKFDKLIASLRAAVENDGVLDKEIHHMMTCLTLSGWQCTSID